MNKRDHPLSGSHILLKSLNCDLTSKEIFILGFWKGEISSDVDRVTINNLNIDYNIRMTRGQVPIDEREILYGKTKSGKLVLFHDCEIDKIVSY